MTPRGPWTGQEAGVYCQLGAEATASLARAGDGAAASSSRCAREEGTTEVVEEVAPGDRGKRPRALILVPDSPPSPTEALAFPVLGPRFVRMGPAPAPESPAEALPSPQQKRRREESGPMAPDPDIRLPAAKWQYR